MKKLFYLLFTTFSFSVSVKGQPVSDYLYPADTLEFLGKISLTDYGDKYFYEDDGGSGHKPINITLRNYDGSTFKTFATVVGLVYREFNKLGLGKDNNYIRYQSISDKLFDNDAEIEFLAAKAINYPNSPYQNGALLYVVNEMGNIEYTFPDTVYEGSISLFKFSGSYKMSYEISANGYSNLQRRTFSLPGSLPCDQCALTSGLVEPNQSGGISELKVNPNPFNNSLEINYNFLTRQDNPRILLSNIIGQEMKSIQLNNQSDKIIVNTSDLPKGTIVVSLLGSGRNVISKKVVKIE